MPSQRTAGFTSISHHLMQSLFLTERPTQKPVRMQKSGQNMSASFSFWGEGMSDEKRGEGGDGDGH
jgi:hypothetical protein